MTVRPQAALIYTSFDDGRGSGGWRVKESFGEASDIDELRKAIRGTLRPDQPLELFPTQEERNRFPRRLEHRLLPGGRSALWHTIPAGKDHTGRPGNAVITAVLLSAEDSERHHGIDFWKSPSWPTPFGSAEVLAAGLDQVADLVPGESAKPELAAEFLFPPDPRHWRRDRLLPLLDAIAERVANRAAPPVALLVRDADEAAAWIAAASAWAAPVWTRRIGWSTWERSEDLSLAGVRTLDVVCAPAIDRESVQSTDWFIFDCASGAASVSRATGPWASAVANRTDGLVPTILALTDLRGRAGRFWLGEHAQEALESEHIDQAAYIRTTIDDSDRLFGEPPPPFLPIAADHPARRDLSRLVVLALGELDRLIAEGAGEPWVNGSRAFRLVDFAFGCNLPLDTDLPFERIFSSLSGASGPQVVELCGPLRSAKARAYVAQRLRYPVADRVMRWADRTEPLRIPETRPEPEQQVTATGAPNYAPVPTAAPVQVPIAPSRPMFWQSAPAPADAPQASTRGYRTLHASRDPKRLWADSVRNWVKEVIRDWRSNNWALADAQELRAKRTADDLIRAVGLDPQLPFLHSPVLADKVEIQILLSCLTVMSLAPQEDEALVQNRTNRLTIEQARSLVDAACRLQKAKDNDARALAAIFYLEIIFAAIRLEREDSHVVPLPAGVEDLAPAGAPKYELEAALAELRRMGLDLDPPRTPAKQNLARRLGIDIPKKRRAR